jgi:hypothetical protein
VKVIREEGFVKVGDLVRNGWSTETRSVQPPYIYGVVVEVQPRSPGAYTPEQIAAAPIRSVKMLSDGKIITRYGIHIEVISESR